MVSQDDVIDYMVMEAVLLKVQAEDRKTAEEKKRKDWRKDMDNLKQTVSSSTTAQP